MRSSRTVVASARVVVPAKPESVWPLIADPGCWRLGPFVHGFDIAGGLADLGPAWVLFTRPRDGVMRCPLFRVIEHEPGRRFVVRCISAGMPDWCFEFTVRPARRGSRVLLRIRIGGLAWGRAGAVRQQWDGLAAAWLRGMREVCRGRRDRPGGSLDASETLTFARRPKPGDVAVEGAAEVDILGSLRHVWQQVWDPETQVRTGGASHAGHVPGTPAGAVGEMQYFVYDVEGRPLCRALVVTRLQPGRSATVLATEDRYEIEHVVEPAAVPGRTRLQIVCRSWGGEDPEIIRGHAADAARGFKEWIEAVGA